jgi:hypothetical protein
MNDLCAIFKIDSSIFIIFENDILLVNNLFYEVHQPSIYIVSRSWSLAENQRPLLQSTPVALRNAIG